MILEKALKLIMQKGSGCCSEKDGFGYYNVVEGVFMKATKYAKFLAFWALLRCSGSICGKS